MRKTWFAVVLVVVMMWGCSSDDDGNSSPPGGGTDTITTGNPDGDNSDSAGVDTSALEDSGTEPSDIAPADDAGPEDAGPPDVSSADTSTTPDALAEDTNGEDSGAEEDATAVDATSDATADAASEDIATEDTPSEDVTAEDAAPEDTAPVETEEPMVGVEDWAQLFGSAGSEEVKAVAADSEGNVYVVGTYRESIVVGTETFEPVEPGSTNPDSFVASFDADGGFRWASSFGGLYADSPFEVDVDGQDRVFVAGSHQGDITIGANTLVCNGSSDVYVVAYDADGVLLWAKNWGGEYGETPRDLSVNASGDIFITGAFTGTIEADGVSVSTPYDFGGLSEIFVLAVDGESKEAMWIQSFTGYGHDVGTGLVADQGRNAVIAVSFQQNLDVDTDQGLSFDSGGDNFDAGLVRLDDQGNVLWANAYGGPGAEEIIGLDMDTAGNIYATGVFSDTASFGGDPLVGVGGHDIMLAGYTGAGAHLWSRGFTGAGFDQAQDLEVAGTGIYITGRFNEDLTLGDIVLNTTNYDVIVARFSTKNGDPMWVETAGTEDADLGNGVGIGGDGGVFAGGHMKGNLTFGAMDNDAMGGNIDAFVLRYTEEPAP